MSKLKKNDTVMVITGKDKGKTGKVLRVLPREGRAIVEGLNFIKKHTRKTREDQTEGIIQKERPIRFSNLMLYCTRCSRPTRIGIDILKDGSKARKCRKCGEIISG